MLYAIGADLEVLWILEKGVQRRNWAPNKQQFGRCIFTFLIVEGTENPSSTYLTLQVLGV